MSDLWGGGARLQHPYSQFWPEKAPVVGGLGPGVCNSARQC